MSVYETTENFPTEESCISFLESLRWKDGNYCPHCGSVKVNRKETSKHRKYWNCHDCKSTFSVTSHTMFHGTKVPLRKWFCAISIVSSAKKSISTYQLARELKLVQKTAWYMLQRIRVEMKNSENDLLKGIVEADEAYVGGKKHRAKKDDDGNFPDNKPNWRDRKVPVIGAVERGGNVVAKPSRITNGEAIEEFLLDNMDINKSILMTDQYPAYNIMDQYVPRGVVNHSERYVNEDGFTHTNTIEGFWACVKRAWYGTHHHYSERFMPLYIAEACYKYNNRRTKNLFEKFLTGCFA